MTSDKAQVGLAFALYLSITFLFAYLAHRRAKKGRFLEHFFVAGREIGPWVLALTWIATSASGGTFIGAPSFAHRYGWVLLLWISSLMVVATVGMGVLGKRVAELGRRTGALTFSDLLRDRFESNTIGTVSGIAIIILYTAYMVAQYIAGARLVEAVAGIPYVWGALGFAVTVSLYTAYGGFRAVAWTDSFQALVMLAGVLVTVFFAVRQAGGLPVVFDSLVHQSPDLVEVPGPEQFLPLPAAISFFLIWPLANLAQPSLMTRFLAAKDTRTLKKASFLIGLYILLLYPAIMTLGVVSRVLVPDLETPDHAIPAVILATVPSLLAGLVLAAPLAAIMSTISSFLLVSSSAIVRDLYQRNVKHEISERTARWLTHVSTFVLAAVALGFALHPPEYLQYIVVFSGTGLAATFLWPTLLGIYWPRMNKAGCLAGMLTGFLSFLTQYAAFGTRSFGGFDPFIWAVLVSLVVSVGVAWMAAPPSKGVQRLYFGDESRPL